MTIHVTNISSRPALVSARLPAASSIRHCQHCCRAEQQERSLKDVKAGIKWDPSYSRWVRDDKIQGKVDAPVYVTPLTGTLPRCRACHVVAVTHSLGACMHGYTIRGGLTWHT